MLKDLFSQWQTLKRTKSNITLLNFGEAKKSAEIKFSGFFSDSSYRNIQEFKNLY